MALRTIFLRFALVLLLALPSFSGAATMFTSGKFQAVDAAGVAVPGCLLYTYSAGTLTPLATYTNQGGATPNANPVVCDAAGQANVWLGTSTYRMILKTAAGVTVWDVDNIGSYATTTDLADTSNVALGDALVGVKRTESGASATTLHAWIQRREVDAEDFTSIQAALNSGASIVNLTAASYNLATGLTMPEGVTLRGRGKAKTTITLTANITPFNVTNVNDVKVEGVLVVAHAAQTAPIILLTASSATIARNNFRDIQASVATLNVPIIKLITSTGAYGIWDNHFEDISASGCGTVVHLETGFAGSWIRENTFEKFYVNDFLIGVDMVRTAGDGSSENVFRDWGAQTSARTTFGLRIPNSSAGQHQYNRLDSVAFYDLQGSAVQYSIGTGVVGTEIVGPTGDVVIAERLSDNGVRTRRPGSAEYLTQLLASGRYLPVPTSAGWTEAVTGSGTTAQQASYSQVRTGTTLNSTARRYTESIGGFSSTSVLSVDFGKRFILGFGIGRATSEANAVGRFQLKTVQTEGALAAKGVGVQVTNYSVSGESYGTAAGSVSLGLTMADLANPQIMIIHYPGVRTEWWVNGVYTAQQTDTTKIPSGITTVYLVHSIITTVSNPSGDAQMFITQPWLWVEL